VSTATADRDYGCNVITAELFALINEKREASRRDPIENDAIISRLNLRFNVGRENPVDFRNATVALTSEELERLNDIAWDQFNCLLGATLQDRVCEHRRAREAAEAGRTSERRPEGRGPLAWLKALIN